MSLAQQHQLQQAAAAKRRLSGPTGASNNKLMHAAQQKENFVNSRTTVIAQDALQNKFVNSPAKKKANAAKKSRVSFSTELEDVRFYNKGGRVSDVHGEPERPAAPPPSRLDALAKEFAKKELAKGEGHALKRPLEADSEPTAVAERETKRPRVSDEFERAATSFFNSAPAFEMPSEQPAKTPELEALPIPMTMASTPSVASLLDELLPEVAPSGSAVPESSGRRASYTLASHVASPSPAERSGASLSSAYDALMAAQPEPVRASTTQQYTIAYEQLMRNFGTAAEEEEVAEEVEETGEGKMEGENLTSDLSGVVQRVMASYNSTEPALSSSSSSSVADMDFTGMLSLAPQPLAPLSLAAAFDVLAPATPVPPATMTMDLTQTFGTFAIANAASAQSGADYGLGDAMETTATFTPSKFAQQPEQQGQEQQEEDQQEQEQQAEDDAMALTRTFSPAATHSEAQLASASVDDLDSMALTRTFSPPKAVTMDFTRVLSPVRAQSLLSAPMAVSSPSSREVTMDLTRTLEPSASKLGSAESTTVPMELTRVHEARALTSVPDRFDVDFEQLLAQSAMAAPRDPMDIVPTTPLTLLGHSGNDKESEELEERESTQTFAHSFVTLLDDARSVEALAPPASVFAPFHTAMATRVAPTASLANMSSTTTLAQLLSECDLWRAFSAAPKSNQSVSLSFAALPPHASVAATKEDLLRVRFSTAAEVSALEQRASELRASIAQLEGDLDAAQRSLSIQPSAVQSQWVTLDEGQRLAAGHRVRRLWAQVRRGVQLERAEQRHAHELARRQRLAAATALARTSSTQGERQRSQLASLEEAMRFDLAQLRQRQRQRQHAAPTQEELAAPLALTPAQAHAREQDMFDILTGAVGWTPMRLAPGELALRFGGDAVTEAGSGSGSALSLQLALNVHQRGPGVPIVQHLVAEASRDSLWHAPLEQLAQAQLARIDSPSALVAAFGALALRVGRVQRLQRDIRLLRARHAQVQVTSLEHSAEVSVLLSSLPLRRRFWLRAKVDADYPMGSLEFRVEASIGGAALERQAKARVSEILQSLRQDATLRFAWLTQLCALLEQWTRGESL